MDTRSIDEVIQSSLRSAGHSKERSRERRFAAALQTAHNNTRANLPPSFLNTLNSVGSVRRLPGTLGPRPRSRPRPARSPSSPDTSLSSTEPSTATSSSKSLADERLRTNMATGNFTDFFSDEVFQLVLHNPTTSHRILKFCEQRACGESMEFIAQVDHYQRLLDDITKTMAMIEKTYTGPNAEKPINISSQNSRAIHNSIKHTVNNVIPSLECIFLEAQEHLEDTLRKDVYPRFVKHQITTSASLAMGSHGTNDFQGLGDSFCLTDPLRADNPIVYASDGFIRLTGYSRHEIVPRNCRFLQGPGTDPLAVKRLKASISGSGETVELILNYRKNGEPFWNLLYVSPLYAHDGKLAFFLGGQINCSTTVHSCTDILRILSSSDDDNDDKSVSDIRSMSIPPPGKDGLRHKTSLNGAADTRGSFFKSFGRWGQAKGGDSLPVLNYPGLEAPLTEKFRNMDMPFESQVEAFYTAFSKYLVLRICPHSHELHITYYSESMLEFLLFPQLAHQAQKHSGFSSRQGPSSLTLFHRDIFKVLADPPLSAHITKTFKHTVRESIKSGKAVSVEVKLMTGVEEEKKSARVGSRRVEKFVSHWTVLKDEDGNAHWVVLTIAPQ